MKQASSKLPVQNILDLRQQTKLQFSVFNLYALGSDLGTKWNIIKFPCNLVCP
jgi:hypothetical protein